jgi:hypothetical protein
VGGRARRPRERAAAAGKRKRAGLGDRTEGEILGLGRSNTTTERAKRAAAPPFQLAGFGGQPTQRERNRLLKGQ